MATKQRSPRPPRGGDVSGGRGTIPPSGGGKAGPIGGYKPPSGSGMGGPKPGLGQGKPANPRPKAPGTPISNGGKAGSGRAGFGKVPGIGSGSKPGAGKKPVPGPRKGR